MCVNARRVSYNGNTSLQRNVHQSINTLKNGRKSLINCTLQYDKSADTSGVPCRAGRVDSRVNRSSRGSLQRGVSFTINSTRNNFAVERQRKRILRSVVRRSTRRQSTKRRRNSGNAMKSLYSHVPIGDVIADQVYDE